MEWDSETVMIVGLTLGGLALWLSSQFTTEPTPAEPQRAVDAERVTVQAATVEEALDHLDALNLSVFPQTRPEVRKLERADYTELLTKLLKETSPLLATTVARVWIGSQLLAVVRLPNPRYAAAADKGVTNG